MRPSIPAEKPRKIQQDACQVHAGPRICVSEENSEVCGQDYCYHDSHPISPIALQSSPNVDELRPPSEQEEISTKYETIVSLTPASKADLEWWIALKMLLLEHQCALQIQQ